MDSPKGHHGEGVIFDDDDVDDYEDANNNDDDDDYGDNYDHSKMCKNCETIAKAFFYVHMFSNTVHMET